MSSGVPAPAPRRPRLLVCSLNWLGDAVMSMPALQLLRDRRPDAEVTLLAKPGLVPLWTMHAAPNRVRASDPRIAAAVTVQSGRAPTPASGFLASRVEKASASTSTAMPPA